MVSGEIYSSLFTFIFKLTKLKIERYFNDKTTAREPYRRAFINRGLYSIIEIQRYCTVFVEKQRCLTREDIAIFRKTCLAKSKIRQITLQRSKKNFYLYGHKGNPAELNTKWNIENNNPNDFFLFKSKYTALMK